MTMRIEILDEQGEVTNTIDANQSFVEEQYPSRWRVSANQPSELPPDNPVWVWYIDIGPFFDRFGAAKMAALTSSDVGVKAILADTQVRKWIDLKRPDVTQSIAYIASVVPSLTAELQDSILNTAVSSEENLALRRVFFS